MTVSQDLRGWLKKRTPQASTPGRIALVLASDDGEVTGSMLEEAFGSAAASRTSVILVSVGYPQSERQAASVERCIEAAWERSVPMHAVLVPTRRAMKRVLSPSDSVVSARR
jgi:hypothetical protein